MTSEETGDLHHHLPGHDLLPVGRGPHVAVGTGKITAIAQIHLEGPEGIESAEIRVDVQQEILESSDHVYSRKHRT